MKDTKNKITKEQTKEIKTYWMNERKKDKHKERPKEGKKERTGGEERNTHITK